MSAVQALKAASAAGVRLGIDGKDLTLEADAAPPPSVIDLLTRHKADLIALLRIGRKSWSGEDWRAFFDERAGIAEFDGGQPREQAEARAHACCVAEWLNRNPVRSSPYSCQRRGEAERMTHYCRSQPSPSAPHGCIRAAGRLGPPPDRPRPSPP